MSTKQQALEIVMHRLDQNPEISALKMVLASIAVEIEALPNDGPISVKDRLPVLEDGEDYEDFLVYDKSMECWMKTLFNKQLQKFHFNHSQITHWMPLPPNPTTDE